MTRFISLLEERGTITTHEKLKYKNRNLVDLLLHLKNKQIMQNTVETQHKHMYL